jgi:hypothetical protein
MVSEVLRIASNTPDVTKTSKPQRFDANAPIMTRF